MSDEHLGKGSLQPPKIDGLLRLYSMKLCPFAQRVRLVLKAKDIKHDIVNITLIEKPEWYFKVHPEGKVPALDTGSKIIVESLDICDYLDENYPEKPLLPSDPVAREKDKELIQKIGQLCGVVFNCLFKIDKKERSPEEWLEEFRPHLELLENELKDRGPFFFGDSPGMVDYMLWPWAERSPCIAFALSSRLPLKEGEYPLLRKWKKEMRKDPTVDSIYTSPEEFWKTIPTFEKV